MSKRKRAKHRRLFPRRYSSDYINVTDKPRALIFDTDSSREPEQQKGEKFEDFLHRKNKDSWFNNHGRVKTVVGPAHNKEVILDNSFMQPIPPTKRLGLNTPKKAVVERLHALWQTEMHQGIEDFYSQTLYETAVKKLQIFFSGNTYCFVETACIDCEPYYAKRSAFYEGREKAMLAFKMKTITWVDSVSLKSES